MNKEWYFTSCCFLFFLVLSDDDDDNMGVWKGDEVKLHRGPNDPRKEEGGVAILEVRGEVDLIVDVDEDEEDDDIVAEEDGGVDEAEAADEILDASSRVWGLDDEYILRG